jgi:hypothetical protein
MSTSGIGGSHPLSSDLRAELGGGGDFVPSHSDLMAKNRALAELKLLCSQLDE